MITRIVRSFGPFEARYYVETLSALTASELETIRGVIAETFEPMLVRDSPSYKEGSFVEIGPRLNVETPFSNNRVAICHAMGLKKVTRIEQSCLYPLANAKLEEVLAKHLDVMTQMIYSKGGITSFDSGLKPLEVETIPVLEQGEEAIHRANRALGLGMDEWDIHYVAEIFHRYGRNPTDVEMFQIAQGLSEHCRHHYFKGKQVIGGVEMPEPLLDIVRAPLLAIPAGKNVSVLAYNDNVGALQGFKVPVFVPVMPWGPSPFRVVWQILHATATAETHNHPTMWAPYPGAATGVGGRQRDNCAGGRGSLLGMAFAGYCVGNLFIPLFQIPGEVVGGETSESFATALRILLEGIYGAKDYGNQSGEPTVGGICRAFEQMVSGKIIGWRKPILYTAGTGHIYSIHAKKHTPEPEMHIVAFGGPAYAIGVGGGAASSMMQGQNAANLDLNSVQRGNGEMGNKVERVIYDCVAMGDDNPIESIHDQGAGGPSNVLTELMETVGGKVDIRQIVLGDKTMSVLTIWSAEYQERYGILIKPEQLKLFQEICERERVNCEVLGKITGDGHVTVIDSANGTTPVRLDLADILGKIPQKIFHSDRIPRKLEPPKLPEDLTLKKALEMVFLQLSVCSKGFIVHGKDRSVGGRVKLQQCCGSSQVPIADFAVLADGFFGLTGVASALGEQPLKGLINPRAGARMALGEMITNMIGAGGISLNGIRTRINWMCAAKLKGEGAPLYDAAIATRDAMITLGIASDGGKDSLSMAAKVAGELVVAPGQVVFLGYASMPDITKVLTPDIKAPGASHLGLIDLGLGKNRLGGSALLQSLNQLGDESPDYDPALLKATWKAVQTLHDCGAILSLHDRSDGGLATTIVEMCLGGNCGFNFNSNSELNATSLAWLFAEELGLVVEYLPENEVCIRRVLKDNGVPFERLGRTTEGRLARVFGIDLPILRQWWEATSHALKKLQTQNGVADEEFASHRDTREPVYHLSFTPKLVIMKDGDFRPKVAVVREEGINGALEMAAAFYTAGFDPYDITMSDLLAGRINLDQFQGLVFPGGFSFMDVFGSAKGWAGVILHNPVLKEMFDRFYCRPYTFSLGVCNGCQNMSLLGWVPFKGMDPMVQPRFIGNVSGRFESRWVQVKIQPSPSILFKDMEGSTLGVHIAHGEGQTFFPDPAVLDAVRSKNLAPLVYVDQTNEPTMRYPFNPNGSDSGIAALCSENGQHTAMMPHAERTFLPFQHHYWPPEWSDVKVSPWLTMFRNAHEWCMQNQ